MRRILYLNGSLVHAWRRVRAGARLRRVRPSVEGVDRGTVGRRRARRGMYGCKHRTCPPLHAHTPRSRSHSHVTPDTAAHEPHTRAHGSRAPCRLRVRTHDNSLDKAETIACQHKALRIHVTPVPIRLRIQATQPARSLGGSTAPGGRAPRGGREVQRWVMLC